MSLIRDDGSLEPTWIQKVCARVVQRGPIPRHVAFIMDGNRRYAVKKQVMKLEGHSKGFDKLAETLKWCQDLGVKEVSVYAFSAENFKRSKEEVDGLMELARRKFQRIMEEKDKLQAHGVRINVVGEMNLLASDIQEMAAKIENITRSNNKCRFNICLAYTSRLEISTAMKKMAFGVEQGYILPEDITDDLITKTLEVSPVDLLIRTSGEVRLSDFLLWQSSFSYLSFLKPLWPEFSIWDFYGAILQYQRAHAKIEEEKQFSKDHNSTLNLCENNARVAAFLKHLNDGRDSGTAHNESVSG